MPRGSKGTSRASRKAGRGIAGRSGASARCRWRLAVLMILVMAAALRLGGLGTAPPGLNQDEAANAWNAACIYKTGTDQTGRRWPLLYMRALGANRSTLYTYAQIPFQAVVGLSPVAARLPSALLGAATVALGWYIGRRLFGPAAGLITAGVLALNPWLLHLTRWGHEAALCPLLALAGVAGLLWMGLSLDGGRPRPRAVPAAVAGFAWGISTWAYPAARIFAPVFFLGVLAVTWRAWADYARAPRGSKALVAFVVVAAALAGPMAYMHLAHPEIMSVRLAHTAVYEPADSPWAKLGKVAARYPGHFGPGFLLLEGDRYEIQSPPDAGMFHWYLLPAWVAGLAWAVAGCRRRRAARVLLLWLVVYPAGDLFSKHMSMHALRSSPGIGAFALLAGFGAACLGRWLWRTKRPLLYVAGAGWALAVVALNATYLPRFFGEYNRRPGIYHRYHVDLLAACEYLRPRLNDADAVLCTTFGMNMPYSVTLVGLGYEPAQWFGRERVVIRVGQWDVVARYGKMHFLYGGYGRRAVRELLANGRTDRAIFVVRPREAAAMRLPPPVHLIRHPDGHVVLVICEAPL